MKNLFIVLCAALSLGLVACDKPAEQAAADPGAEAPKAEEKPAEEKPAEPAAAEAPAAKIEVAAAGAKIDPPVKPEQLPEGAWYCDMGTVHWAAMDKPADGKCPECGMELKQYAAAAQAAQEDKAIEAKPDDHGHEHGEGEGDHDHAH